MNGSERTGRDGRLLALVIVVSLAVLLVLAKFRFASDGPPPTPTGPLDGSSPVPPTRTWRRRWRI